jgi:hypothetical protein
MTLRPNPRVPPQPAQALRRCHELALSIYHAGRDPGPAGRTFAVTVPSLTLCQRAGHLVDRRPPAGADPYRVVRLMGPLSHID